MVQCQLYMCCQLSGSQPNFYILCAAMTLLYAVAIARTVALALRNAQPKDKDAHEAAEAVELLKELLTQVRVLPNQQEHSDMANFCHSCLWSIRGILNNWDVTCTSVHCGVAPQMHQHLRIWKIEHPNRQILLSEIESGLRFLGNHNDIFVGQPWEWLTDFLMAVEADLQSKKP